MENSVIATLGVVIGLGAVGYVVYRYTITRGKGKGGSGGGSGGSSKKRPH
jgi:hypothetical protein